MASSAPPGILNEAIGAKPRAEIGPVKSTPFACSSSTVFWMSSHIRYSSYELYLMCDDIQKTVDELQAKGVDFTGPISARGFAPMASFKIPGGAELAIYQPRHPSAIQQPG